MQAIEILDIKKFMQLLLQTEALHAYELVSAEVRTDLSYSIDGKINRSFYDREELSEMQIENRIYLPWRYARKNIFSLIRGKKTPSFIKLVLRADDAQTGTALSGLSSSLNPNDIDGIFLNILFQENKLHVTCGIAYRIFTMDKELENRYADYFVSFLKSNGIACVR